MQAPDFAQRPSTGGGAATTCPASSLSMQGPPISRATTQDPAAPLPVLHPHPRKPPISRNDPARAVGLPPPVLHPHCPCKAPRSREQRPSMSGGAATAHLSSSTSVAPFVPQARR